MAEGMLDDAVVLDEDRRDPGRDLGGEGRGRPPLITKRTMVGVAIFVAVLVFFLTQTRLPATLLKLQTAERGQSARGRLAFGQVVDPDTFPPHLRWVAYGLNLWDGNAIGMFFAMLLGGAVAVAVSPTVRLRRLLVRRGPAGAGVGGALGLPLLMCSACSAPVSLGFYRTGASLETSLGVILGSSLFNPVALVAMFAVLPPAMGLARVAWALGALFLLTPLVARWERRRPGFAEQCLLPPLEVDPPPPPVGERWGAATLGAVRDWVASSADVAWRLGPPMLAATLAVGLIFNLVPPQSLSDRLGSGLLAVVVAAAAGTLLQTPALFEIPLAVGLLALGLGVGPAAALLVTAPSPGLVTLGIVRADLGWRVPALLLAGTFAAGVLAGVVVG